jgi:hypothetical protein
MPRTRVSIRALCQSFGAASFLALSAGCLPPVVVTFQGTPTPVLLSKVDRVGGTPLATTPPPIASFKGNVRSQIYSESTTVTETTNTTTTGGTGPNTGYSTGDKPAGYSTGDKPAGYSTTGDDPPGYAGSNKSKYSAPPRTPTSTPPNVYQNEYVYGAGAFHQEGPNLLTFYALKALYSEAARRANPNPPNPKDIDIFITSFRVRSIFFSYKDTETEQSDPETKTTGSSQKGNTTTQGQTTTSTTTTTKQTTTVYKVNGARVKAVITPKR